MNILHVSSYDSGAGAARAASRLNDALISEGVFSRMLVQTKGSDSFSVIAETNRFKSVLNKFRKILENVPLLFYKDKMETYFSPAWVPFGGIAEKINNLNPDLVHLHWICHGMIAIEDLVKIKAPIVWTLHDNWAFTGGCHIKWNCEKYKLKCGNCPILRSKTDTDLSRKIWLRKKKTYSKLPRLTIIAPSRWIANCAKESSLLCNRTVVVLPNPIDTTVFKPFDKSSARELLNLPQDKKLILFGAFHATGDVNKGFKQLKEALHNIHSENVECVVFGANRPKDAPGLEMPTHYIGKLFDDVSLRLAYNAADVMVVPSLQEAFGQTATEAMACAVPVVAFGATGLLDIIDHKINGFLSIPFDPESLAEGIDWVINTPSYLGLCNNAREKIVHEFDRKIVAVKCISLYAELIENVGSLC